MLAGFQRLEGLRCGAPDGTFHAFPKFPESWGGSRSLADHPLETAGLVVRPGAAYGPGGDHNPRLSFATSMEMVEEGRARLEKFLLEQPLPRR